ncbi:MAG: hypothetical protein K2R98_33545 [Gemmataceae bacterium]|nr:hypothetical protein [Gemmataceae bacterium]
MSEASEPNPFVAEPYVRPHPPLPSWFARRFLRPDEQVHWVRGPWFTPVWERYVTHPGLFVAALALGGVCLLIGRPNPPTGHTFAPMSILIAVVIVLASIYVLAFFSGYFTRLVVTNTRLLIVQGYEVRRCWDLDDLPSSLVRYGRQGGQGGPNEMPSVDVAALQSILGGKSDQFVDAKAIREFGKKIDRIKGQEGERR